MSDDASRSEAENKSSELDLSQLGGLSLGPDWGTGSIPPSKTPKSRGRDRGDSPGGRRSYGSDDRGGRPGDGPGGHRDRRAGKTARRSGGFEGGGRGPRPGGDEGGSGGRRFGARRDTAPPFEPILRADFYPDDNAFKALTQAIKHSCRTFELFEIARLILEKPERWVCVARHPDQKEGEAAILHASVPDGLPFESEQAALTHVFTRYLDQFFDIEEYEAEPPTGSFQMVHRCGMTGEIIGPPNFHRYQAMLREHHAARLPHVPFEKVQARLESVREQEAIDAWMEAMRKGRRFTLKVGPEGSDPIVMEDFESARLYLLTHAKEKLVRPAYSVRFFGKDLHLLAPSDPLRRSIEALHQHQLRFPLETANNLRGRLRRLHLAVYKRGSKGVSYVCAVKRRFREPNEVLAENLSDLISFLDAHPNTKAGDLPRQYLGMGEEASAPKTEGAGSAEEAPKENEALVGLKRDLRYLVSQGYVIEYSDGRLQVPPAKEAPEPKESSPEAEKPSAPEFPPATAEAPAPEAETPSEPTDAAPVAAAVEATEPVSPAAPEAETPSEPEPEPLPAAEEAPAAPPAPETEPTPEPEPVVETPSAEASEPTPEVPPEVEPEAAADAPSEEPVAEEETAPEPSPEPAPVSEETKPKGPTEPGTVRPRGESEPS